MTYVVDAQLPKRLARWIADQGLEAVHTLDLPDRNETADAEIIRIVASADDAVVVSKDRDFPEQRILRGEPKRLLWVTTGNIVNNKLMELFAREFSRINDLFESGSLLRIPELLTPSFRLTDPLWRTHAYQGLRR